MSGSLDRFTAQERGALFWVCWWMGQQQEQRRLGGTLTLALATVRQMVGKFPDGFDPLDFADDFAIMPRSDLEALIAAAKVDVHPTTTGDNPLPPLHEGEPTPC